MKALLFLLLCSLFIINRVQAQPGCTDPLATNYNSAATVNDGSCVYAASSVSPASSFNLSASLPETSGLIQWNNQIWTHNDNTDISIYSLDTIDGNLIQSHPLTGAVNIDWEEISQDSSYVYMGDFGNNANGNRTDLKILRIEKNSILLNAPVIDTINYSYSDQSDFTPTGSNNTNFDCEAFVVSMDSIYLFTKQWVSNKTSIYSMPKIPGSYVASLKTTFDVQGLITGAVLLENQRLIALSGYSSLLQPFIFLLYDFTGTDYFSGNKRKISVSLPFYQVEGIATANGLKYYLTNEYFSQPPITTPQKFHIVDLSSFLGNYLTSLTQSIAQLIEENNVLVFPNPANNNIIIESKILPANYYLLGAGGQIIQSGKLVESCSEISIGDLQAGMYLLKLGEENGALIRIIKTF